LKREFSFIRGNYLVLVVSWIFMDFANEIPGTYYSLYILALQGTEFSIGLINFVSFLALASVQFPGGYLADKYGRRWLVSTMTFGVALSFIFYAFAPSWHIILVGAVITNLCLLYQPALLAMIADSLPSERRGMGYSIINLIASVSTTPGPAIAAILFLSYGLIDGMRIAYLIVFAMYLTAAMLRINLKETVKEPAKISRREFLNSYPKALKESGRVFKVVPRAMLFLFLANLFGTFSFAMVMPFFVVYATKTLGISEVTWSLLLIFLFIAMIVSALPCGKFIDKIGRKIPLLLSYVIMVPAVLLFVFGDFWRLLISLILFGLNQVLVMSAFSSLQADLVPKEQRGKVIGFTNFVNYLLMALGSVIGSVLYSIWPPFPFFILLLLLIPEFLIVQLFVNEPEKRQE